MRVVKNFVGAGISSPSKFDLVTNIACCFGPKVVYFFRAAILKCRPRKPFVFWPSSQYQVNFLGLLFYIERNCKSGTIGGQITVEKNAHALKIET